MLGSDFTRPLNISLECLVWRQDRFVFISCIRLAKFCSVYTTQDFLIQLGASILFFHQVTTNNYLKIILSTFQTQEARQAYDEAATRANDNEENHQKARDELAEQLKSALKDLEKEEELRKKWETDAREKNSQVHKMTKENDELKQKMDEIMKENTEKDKILRIAEEKCVELESEKNIIAQFKNDLELKLAELRTHRDKESHDIRLQNEDLKLRLARAGEITGDELGHVLTEIVELKEEVGSLSNEKENLKEQLKESKVKESKFMKEVDILKQSNIEILQTNKELLEQNEALMVKSRNLESALEETLEERFLPQSEADPKDPASDSVDGGDRTIHDKNTPSPSDKGFGSPGGSGRKPNEEILKLLEEIQELKEYTEILKETNENLCIELDKKHETELDLLNKISELEDDLYRSAQEGFESEKDDKETLIKRRKTMELNLKHANAENDKLRADLEKKEDELIIAQVCVLIVNIYTCVRVRVYVCLCQIHSWLQLGFCASIDIFLMDSHCEHARF